MTNKPENTSPLPWSYLYDKFGSFVLDANGEHIVQDWDKFEETFKNAKNNCEFIVEACNNYQRLQEENKALREQNQWISVEKDLPEPKGVDRISDVVFAMYGGQMILACYGFVDEGDEGCGYVWMQVYDGLDGDPQWDDDYSSIKFWRPIPPAPNEEPQK